MSKGDSGAFISAISDTNTSDSRCVIGDVSAQVESERGAVYMKLGSKALTFLHISDLHLRTYDDPLGGPPARPRSDLDHDLRAQLLQDAGNLARRFGKIDGILASGDVAYAGKAAEYDVATEYLRQLCTQLEVPPAVGPVQLQQKAYLSQPGPGGQIRSEIGHLRSYEGEPRCSPDAKPRRSVGLGARFGTNGGSGTRPGRDH